MASTFSQTLRLELIGDGDQSGIWGQTTNTNLGTLIEQAIAGVVTITMTDANYTLTNFNGVSDEARNQVIVATGTNAAVRDIIIPLVEKTYTIKNSTTGGYGVRIIGSSGTGVTVPNGVTTTVYCDGINVFTAMSGTTNDFTVAGNATITGNLTVTGSSTIAPIGSILMWSTGSAPTGYLLCNGAAVSRSTYAALFAVVGTTFGVGDGSTTFNLPNYTNRLPYGTTVGATGGSSTISAANLPSHTHTFSGTTSGMNASNPHGHGVFDPGHFHGGIPQPTPDVDRGGASSLFSIDAYGNTSLAFTGIGIGQTDINHGHAYSGTTDATGSGNAFLPPYLGISFIIKF